MVINKKTKAGTHSSEGPDWNTAPDWATYAVHDLFTGQWVWLEKHPHCWRDGEDAMVTMWERRRKEDGEA